MKGLFITGTDTDIGKTYLTATLTRALRKSGIPAVGLKPLLCGDRRDAEELFKACDREIGIDLINPFWLSPPLAPYAASIVESRKIDLQPVFDTLSHLENTHSGPFLVEGVGGWLVPITREYWLRDLAVQLGLPVLVVASVGLGTLNHTLLTVESIRNSGCYPVGIILNRFGAPPSTAAETNPAILADLTGLPVYAMDENDPLVPIPLWLLGCCKT